MTDRPPVDPHQVWHDEPARPRPADRQVAGPRKRKSKGGSASARPRRRWLSVAGYGALAFACLGAAALAFLLIAAPVDIVRDRIIEQVKARTGRDLVVAGPTSLSFFPRLAVSLSDVSLSAPEGMEAAPTLVVPALDVEVRFWSLLMRQVALDRVTLNRPTVELSVDAQGRRSWESDGARSRSPRPALSVPGTDARQPPGEPSRADESRAAAAFSRLGLASIRITDATVHYRDQKSGSHTEIKSLDLTLTANDIAGPLEISGGMAWRGARITLAGTASPLRALLADQPAQLALKVSGAPFEAAYEGTLALGAGVSLDGMLNLKAPSAQALADWLGKSLPKGADSDALTLSAQIKTERGRTTLTTLDAGLGANTMAGSLTLETGQGRSRISGNLQVSELDFGRLLLRPGRSAAAAPDAPPSAAPPPVPVKQADSKSWSDDPINLPVLGLLDAKLAVTAGRIIYKDVRTGRGRLSVALEGGLATVTLEDIELYTGRARGILTLDGTGEVLVTGANLKLDGVAIRPLLTDTLRFPWLEGRGSITLALAGQGLSERQIVETLNGKIEVTTANGAITGIDAGKIVRSLQQGRVPNLNPTPDDKTPFRELAGSFTVVNGVAKNQDLRLVSTHLQLNGEGTLDLGPRQIDYTVRAKVGSGAPEPGAVVNVGSLEVPVGIVGPWERPTFTIKGQEQLTGALKQIGKNLKSQDVKDAIKGLLRGDGEKRVRPRDVLEKLLKKE